MVEIKYYDIDGVIFDYNNPDPYIERLIDWIIEGRYYTGMYDSDGRVIINGGEGRMIIVFYDDIQTITLFCKDHEQIHSQVKEYVLRRCDQEEWFTKKK